MTNAERFDMGWASIIGSNDAGGQRGRRCCPVCKAACAVGTVVPIYVRDGDDDNNDAGAAAGRNGGVIANGAAAAAAAAAAASGNTDRRQGAENVDVHHDITASTGLRRRRREGACGNASTDDNDNGNDHDNLSLSTISTDGDPEDENGNSNRHHRRAISPPHHQQSASSEIPSRPTPQPYLHQQSSMEDDQRRSRSVPTTPLVNNHHRRSGSGRAAGIGTPLPPSPPRAARPSSLSNGLSLSFWSSVVDAILGNSTSRGNVAGGNNGGRNGYVPPIHRPGGWRGRSRVSNGGNGDNFDGREVEGEGPGENGSRGGAESRSARDNVSAGMGSSSIAGPHYPPVPTEDVTTEFLSRLLLMLGSFVIFCLLLF